MDILHSDSTRDRIKTAAAEIYVARGYNGFSFGDIADVVGGTRANIHHHFGSKRKLVDELVRDIARDAKNRIAEHWLSEGVSFWERFDRQIDDLRRFYIRYNPRPGDRRIWSPVSRLRHDLESLGPEAMKALEGISAAYDAALRQAIGAAVRGGELRGDTPVDDLAGFLRAAFLACPPLTQDRGRFEDVEAFLSTLRTGLRLAWGHDGSAQPE